MIILYMTSQSQPNDKFITLDQDLYDYLLAVSLREPEILRRLRLETSRMPQRGMQISPDQGQFMAMLARLLDARRVLEIGVFTGYSSLCLALALPPDGHLTALDVSEEWTAVARRYWREAGVEDKIDLRLASALDSLDELIRDGQSDSYEMAFIDADKHNYHRYFEQALQLVRVGGLIIFDNMLWNGRVVESGPQDESTQAIRSMNKQLHGDERVEVSLLTIGDGVTLARRVV